MRSKDGCQLFLPMIIFCCPTREANGVKKLMAFIREARAELKKVTWPSRQQVWYSTLIVIGVTLLVAAYLGVIDAVLTVFFSKVMKLG